MWIRSVTAHSFGPLIAEKLDFAEGMTVVVGDNESAKSSWHAAIYAALCGRRRGRGRARQEEQSFADAHKPWDRDDWLVSAEIGLDDGRTIELRQDLAGLVDCHAKELAIAKDVSSEIMNEGTPDASKWLGLDRTSFASTACIQQGQMLGVRDAAASLQDYLQRAAASAGTDATAAAAISRINNFFAEHVGRDIAGTNKPLRTAIVGVTEATGELEKCRADHEEYLSRLQRVESLQQFADDASDRVKAFEAASAAESAGKLRERARRARELHEVLGDREPTSSLSDDDLAQRVADAVALWRSRPARAAALEKSSVQLQDEIDKLPPPPVGDTEPHPSVVDAVGHLRGALTQLELHNQTRPSASEDAQMGVIESSDAELLELASLLSGPAPTVLKDLSDREAAARSKLDSTRSRIQISSGLIVAGLFGAIIGILLLTRPTNTLGIATASVGIVLCIAGLLVRLSSRRSLAVRALAEAQGLLDSDRKRVAAQIQKRSEATALCLQLGVPASAEALRQIPATRARAAESIRNQTIWSQQDSELEAKVRTATSVLCETLTARGCESTDADPETLITTADAYIAQCRGRAEQAMAASARVALVAEMEAVQKAEQRAIDDEKIRSQASNAVLTAAKDCGISCDSAEEAAQGLEGWTKQRAARQEGLAAQQRQWAELQTLLGNDSIEKLEKLRDEAVTRADTLAEQSDPVLLSSIAAISSTPEALSDLRRQAQAAGNEAATERGELQLFSAELGSVAEAEEALAQAQAELERVKELKETLDLTKRFLEDAQTRVFRDIAPALAATVREWLPNVTGERYLDVTIEPSTLEVQVCGPLRRWRRANLLSYGTSEQIYLLLRVALAEHLTRGKETCPLLLDDITVHADTPRTRKILDLLLKISSTRQIVLFTQEDQVADWAREHLTGPRNKIQQLEQVIRV